MITTTWVKLVTAFTAAVIALLMVGVYAHSKYGRGNEPDSVGSGDWIGLSAEANPPIEDYDQTSLITTGADGQTTLAGKFPISFEPRMQRLGAGFAFPAGDQIVVVDDSLHEVRRIEIDANASLTRSATSEDGSEAVFALDVGMNDSGEKRQLLVKLSKSGSVAKEYVEGEIFGLSICRSESVQWMTAMYNSSPSSVRMDKWSPGRGVDRGSQVETGKMAFGYSPIVCGDRAEGDRGYPIAASDTRGYDRILEISHEGGLRQGSEREVPTLPGNVQGKAWGVSAGTLYWITREGNINYIALAGEPNSGSIELPIGGDKPLSATFERDSLYLIHYPSRDRSLRTLTEFNLSQGICKGASVDLANWRYQSNMAAIRRAGASFIAVTSMFPARPEHSVQCSY